MVVVYYFMSTIPTFARVVKAIHRTYTRAEISGILDYLTQPTIPHGALTKISDDTGIPQTTLSSWRQNRLRPGQHEWFPGESGRPNRRILPLEVEASISEHLHANFIDSGVGATRRTLKTLALNAYSSQDPEDMRDERFTASGSFLSRFQRRWNLSLRTPHPERRTDPDPVYTNYFLRRLNSLHEFYPDDQILNMDETCWKLYLAPNKVLAEKGSSAVKLQSSKSEKESITAFGAIKADGTKLPLWVIAKGKTRRCERKYGEHPDVIISHSPSGWATETLIVDYFKWLHFEILTKQPCVLVLDIFPTHRTPAVESAALAMDIELLYVPAGATGELQPLDRRIFGELKSRARMEFDRIRALTGSIDIDGDASVGVLANCWSRISGEHVRAAWHIA